MKKTRHPQRHEPLPGEASRYDIHALTDDALRKAWKKAKKSIRRKNATRTDKAIHDARVSIRRILAAFSLAKEIAPQRPRKKLARRLKSLLKALGPARDSAVERANAEKFFSSSPFQKKFASELADAADSAEKEAVNAMDNFPVGKISRLIKEFRRELLHAGADRDAKDRGLAAAIMKADRRFAKVRAERDKLDPARPDTIHKMRLAFKKFRYTAELLQPALLGFPKTRLKEMHAFQQRMGDIQDMRVLRESLQSSKPRKKREMGDFERMTRELELRMDAECRSFAAASGKIFSFWAGTSDGGFSESRSRLAAES